MDLTKFDVYINLKFKVASFDKDFFYDADRKAYKISDTMLATVCSNEDTYEFEFQSNCVAVTVIDKYNKVVDSLSRKYDFGFDYVALMDSVIDGIQNGQPEMKKDTAPKKSAFKYTDDFYGHKLEREDGKILKTKNYKAWHEGNKYIVISSKHSEKDMGFTLELTRFKFINVETLAENDIKSGDTIEVEYTDCDLV